jgi:hypothetical protein
MSPGEGPAVLPVAQPALSTSRRRKVYFTISEPFDDNVRSDVAEGAKLSGDERDQ